MVAVPPPGPNQQIQAPPRNECSCQSNYNGVRCERFECIKQCKNGGECASTGDHRGGGSSAEMMCLCPSGFTGDECEEEAEASASCLKKCLNGGECFMPDPTNDPNTMACTCPQGFKGERCEISYETCLDLSQCLNGGACVAPLPGSGSEAFSCNCPDNTSGVDCGTPVVGGHPQGQGTPANILEDIEEETGLSAAGVFAIVVSCLFFVISAFLLADTWRQHRGYRLSKAAAKVNTDGVFDPVELCNEVERGIF